MVKEEKKREILDADIEGTKIIILLYIHSKKSIVFALTSFHNS